MRYLRLWALILALVPSVAMAATIDWIKGGSTAEAVKLNPGDCATFSFTSANTANDNSSWLDVQGQVLTLQFDADETGSATGAKVTIDACTNDDGDADGTKDANACSDYEWDTDGDGIVDGSELDGTTAMKRGVGNVTIPGSLYAVATVLPAAGDTAVLRVCAEVK